MRVRQSGNEKRREKGRNEGAKNGLVIDWGKEGRSEGSWEKRGIVYGKPWEWKLKFLHAAQWCR